MSTKRFFSTIPVIAALAVTGAPAAASAATQEAVSANWAGYAAGANSSNTPFSNVSGSWTVPAAKCTGSQTYSAFWVGLGGSGQSTALEQTGTQSDCGADGTPQYYAWYELVPAGPVRLSLSVSPGDKITAKVGVSGDQVAIFLSDDTTGKSVTKNLQMSNPDTSTAEWIAEAPSLCQGGATGNCSPLALADFGSVKFSGATATAGGHTGTISDWNAEAVALSPGASSGIGGDGFSAYDPSSSSSSTAGAQPSSLSSDGSSFSVDYVADATQSASSSPTGSYGGSGGSSGDSGGYGYGYGSGGDTGSSGYSGGYGYGGDGGYSGGYGYGGDGGYGYSYGGGYGDDGSGGYVYVPVDISVPASSY